MTSFSVNNAQNKISKYTQQFFTGLFTFPWILHIGTLGVQAVFFWYSYFTMVQENGIIRIENAEPAKFISSSIFTPQTPANPLNYIYFFWICFGIIIAVYTANIWAKNHSAGKTSTLLFWIAWFAQIILAIGTFPLFFATLG